MTDPLQIPLIELPQTKPHRNRKPKPPLSREQYNVLRAAPITAWRWNAATPYVYRDCNSRTVPVRVVQQLVDAGALSGRGRTGKLEITAELQFDLTPTGEMLLAHWTGKP